MTMRELAYQQRVLKLLDDYLDKLVEQKNKADKIEQANSKEVDPDLRRPPFDFPKTTWEALKKVNKLPLSRADIPYSPRPDGVDRAVPNIVYKVPTAGGKTYLAMASLMKIFNKYLNRNTGFVLWIVPNEAIYSQTKKQLTDRRHPYRQLLDNLSGNAVKIMEKKTPLNAQDVDSNLCVMLLMLQSSNRENKNTLKIFQERGDVHGFTPEEGNQLAHQNAKKATPNLDTCDLSDSNYRWLPIRDSLGNALRVIRPIVVMDEGHKATSELAFKTLYDFNPSFVLELTATPKDIEARTGKNPKPARHQNILVEISGVELDREGMIKMPLNLDSRQSTDWRATLKAGLDRLNDLAKQAQQYQANTERYIRPIMLVQVERTGEDQRDGKYIHADDVQEWLTSTGKLHETEVAIKTSQKNDLKQPENQDLLSTKSSIRVIITQRALQEGWDCPFAYVLCALASNANPSAMTQLIGRILRQPHAQKTDVAMLNESYIVTHHTSTDKVVKGIKKGLEKDGMGDLVHSISISGEATNKNGSRTIPRNSRFKTTQIFLPKLLRITETKEKRELDYEEDILFALDWNDLDVTEWVKDFPKNHKTAERQLRKIWLEDNNGKNLTKDGFAGSPAEDRQLDYAHITQCITDIIPNPWIAHKVVGNFMEQLKNNGFKQKKLGQISSFIINFLRDRLIKIRDEKSEKLFRTEVKAKRIQFHLHTNDDIKKMNWEMPFQSSTNQLENARQLSSNRGEPLQQSLFLPMYEEDMNKDERTIALYLDDEETMHWWHRNVARNHYSLQGWRKDKIYPDFICALKPNDYSGSKLVVLEMKGEHLAGNRDTEYKKSMLALMNETFSMETAQHVGEADLLGTDGITMHCDLVLFSNWEERLSALLH